MRALILTSICLLCAGLANAKHIPGDYAGQDAGTIVLGMGATTGTAYSSYTLLFRTRTSLPNKKKPDTGRFAFRQVGAFGTLPTDYSNANEAGVLLIFTLPPGDYEIYNFEIFDNNGLNQTTFGSRVDFSIPFTVRPGEVTYLGNYQANGLKGKNFLGLSLPAGAVFVVTSRLSSDLAIAQKKATVNVETATDATPDAAKVGNPYIASQNDSGQTK